MVRLSSHRTDTIRLNPRANFLVHLTETAASKSRRAVVVEFLELERMQLFNVHSLLQRPQSSAYRP